MQFKVGDKVKIKPPLSVGLTETIGIIERIDEGCKYPIKVTFSDGSFLWCREFELELIKDNDLLKSKIGD